MWKAALFLFCPALLAIPGWTQALPDGPGKDVFASVCSQCHTLDRVLNLKLTKEEWQEKVDRMGAKGASASKEEFTAIVDYLAKNFPSTAATASAGGGEKDLPEGPGKQIILRECTACHAPDHFTKYHHSPEEWQVIVTRMGQRVRSATTAELDSVQKYLTTNFPKAEDNTKLNMNKASANDIAARLNLSAEEARAIVQYRVEHGDYREWGELLVVYGVDGRKIKAVKDLMSF